MDELPPVSSVAGVCCFVGSTTFRLSEADATKAYLTKNPGWSGKLGIAVMNASKPLKEGVGPEQGCVLACLDTIAAKIKNRAVVVQTMMVRNAAYATERIPICFATVFAQSDKTKIMLLDDDPIPY